MTRVRTPREVAEAFSLHRFREAYDALAPDVVWTAVGAGRTVGREAVVRTCEALLHELAGTAVTVERVLTVADGDAVAVDAVTRYDEPGGGRSVVSACDLYEFRHGAVATIRSYAVELEAG